MRKLILPTLSVLAMLTQSSVHAQYKLPRIQVAVEKYDDALDKIIAMDPEAEVIVAGFKWVEGPLWVEDGQMLLFSEIPSNTVYKWNEEQALSVYLQPSGYTGEEPSKRKEPGSNGLLLDPDGVLVLCQHGDRRMAKMEAPLNKPEPKYTTLVERYKNMRLSSPNDAVYGEDGTLFFTDPPYGLPSQGGQYLDKEIPFNGVYRLGTDGELLLLTDAISRPNGIALFPDQKTLLVSNSDGDAPAWYTIDATSPSAQPQLFYDAKQGSEGEKGLPDGLKFMKNGTVVASGPGGVWIFNADAKLLGKIKIPEAVSNVALSDDQQYMYLTNTSRIVRVRLK